jgi:hypothetical protein
MDFYTLLHTLRVYPPTPSKIFFVLFVCLFVCLFVISVWCLDNEVRHMDCAVTRLIQLWMCDARSL